MLRQKKIISSVVENVEKTVSSTSDHVKVALSAESTSETVSSSELTMKLKNQRGNDSSSSIIVMVTGEGDSRVYDKRFYCPFCSKPQSKLPRHLRTMHSNESEVAKYEIEQDKKKKEQMIIKLRNLGNYLHNNEVIKEGKGTLVVKYRPASDTSWLDYVPCDMCLGYYIHYDLWKHRKRCHLRIEGQKIQGKVVSKSRLLLPSPKSTSSDLEKVLENLSNDEIGKVVRSDSLILQFGEKLSKKMSHDAEQYSNVRNTLRELGRLLLRLRKTVGPGCAPLSNFLHPNHFKDVIQATKEVAGFNEETHLMKTPSLALKIGTSLKHCAAIRKRIGLENLDENLVKESKYFDELCEEHWSEEVSTHALRTLGENKRNKVKLIPLTSDCRILTEHLKERGRDAYQALEVNNKNLEAYKDLCEITLTQVILFNRRRQGEVSKMKLDDFLGCHHAEEEDIQESLSPLEQKLCKALTRIEIVGKRGRTVPVILTAEMKHWIDLLIKSRGDAGVNESNKFVFARSAYGSTGHVRGSDCLRKFSMECGAKQPKLLRSTKLRKQIATLSQILNLKENELDILANFLGHDIRIHREFYRLPERTLEIAKVSKLLFSLENGQFCTLGGKSLDEIEVNVDEEIGIEVNDCEEEVSEDEHEEDETIDHDTHRSLETQEDADAVTKRKEPGHKTKKRPCPWSLEEKNAVLRHFTSHISLAKIPKKDEAEECLKKEKMLQERTWRNIKDFVRNTITSRKKKTVDVF